MEQTSHTPDLTPTDLVALRQDVTRAILAQAQGLLRSLQEMEPPKIPQEVSRRAQALLALSRVFDRLLPEWPQREEVADIAPDSETKSVPVFRNRQERRKAQAKVRKGAFSGSNVEKTLVALSALT